MPVTVEKADVYVITDYWMARDLSVGNETDQISHIDFKISERVGVEHGPKLQAVTWKWNVADGRSSLSSSVLGTGIVQIGTGEEAPAAGNGKANQAVMMQAICCRTEVPSTFLTDLTDKYGKVRISIGLQLSAAHYKKRDEQWVCMRIGKNHIDRLNIVDEIEPTPNYSETEVEEVPQTDQEGQESRKSLLYENLENITEPPTIPMRPNDDFHDAPNGNLRNYVPIVDVSETTESVSIVNEPSRSASPELLEYDDLFQIGTVLWTARDAIQSVREEQRTVLGVLGTRGFLTGLLFVPALYIRREREPLGDTEPNGTLFDAPRVVEWAPDQQRNRGITHFKKTVDDLF